MHAEISVHITDLYLVYILTCDRIAFPSVISNSMSASSQLFNGMMLAYILGRIRDKHDDIGLYVYVKIGFSGSIPSEVWLRVATTVPQGSLLDCRGCFGYFTLLHLTQTCIKCIQSHLHVLPTYVSKYIIHCYINVQ